MRMNINKRRDHGNLFAKITNFADKLKVMQRFKSWILPIAIVLGVFFHEYIIVLQPALPYLIFLMLYFSFNSLDVKTMRFSMFDFWLLLFQLVVSTVVYFLIRPFDEIVAQGGFVTVLAPTAAAAIAVSLILGANISMMSTYLISCNLMVAVVAPLSFTLIGASPDISFWISFLAILGKVFPLLIAPFILAVLTRWLLPKANSYINQHKSLSFYVWAVSLTVVISRAIGLLMTQFHEHRMMFLWMVVVSIFLCFIQFFVGHLIGKKYGDRVAGGQALGQKNTVLAIWMAQSYLNPLSSIVPTLYVIWQNLYNSFQMMQKERAQKQI
jgi:BASS family bile acid:Na+ symporter